MYGRDVGRMWMKCMFTIALVRLDKLTFALSSVPRRELMASAVLLDSAGSADRLTMPFGYGISSQIKSLSFCDAEEVGWPAVGPPTGLAAATRVDKEEEEC